MPIAELAPGQSSLLGVMAVAALIAAAVLRILLPTAQPMLEEACRGAQRGRFWTRFLGIALLLAIPLGVVLGFVAGERLDHWDEEGLLQNCASMLRLGIQLGAFVLVLTGFGVMAAPKAQRQ